MENGKREVLKIFTNQTSNYEYTGELYFCTAYCCFLLKDILLHNVTRYTWVYKWLPAKRILVLPCDRLAFNLVGEHLRCFTLQISIVWDPKIQDGQIH